MSLFNYYYSYRHLNSLFTVSYSNENIEEISMEGFMDTIKKIIQKIKHFIKVVAKNILKGLTKILDFLFKRSNLDSKRLKLLSKEDRETLYRNSLLQYSNGVISLENNTDTIIRNELMGPNGRTVYFINQDGSIIDVDTEFKKLDNIRESIIKDYYGDHDKQLEVLSQYTRPEVGFNVKTVSDLDKIDFDKLYSLINPDNIASYKNEMKNKMHKDMWKYENEIDKIRVSEDIRPYEKVQLIDNLKTFQKVVSLKYQIYQAIVGFYQIISYRLSNGDGFNVEVENNEMLYHLSFDDKLMEGATGDVLKPRIPPSAEFKDTDTTQILPERIPFSPKIENCFVGMWFRAYHALYEDTEEKETYIITVLYRGIPNAIKGIKTTKLKKKYVKQYIDEWEGSKEICITSDIKIEKIGYVKIYIDIDKVKIVKHTDGKRRAWSNAYKKHTFVTKREFDEYMRGIN